MKLLLCWMVVLVLVLACRAEPVGIDFGYQKDISAYQNQINDFIPDEFFVENPVLLDPSVPQEISAYDKYSKNILLTFSQSGNKKR